MERKDIEERVKRVISETAKIDEKKITGLSSLQEELGIDSFMAVEIAYHAEEAFGIQLPDSELQNFKTVDDIVKAVQKILSASE